MPLIDLTGRVVGRLTVIERAEYVEKWPKWRCVCECGKEAIVRGANLRNKHTTSCGCRPRAILSAARLKHGEGANGAQRERSREYTSWMNMIQRCTNPKRPDYRLYGGRGISVCERWRNFETFLEDMGRRPTPKHSLDRYPDNDGNYEPGNVRWATAKEQRANQRE